MAWSTIEAVEDLLGFASDERMVADLAASEAWCQRQRPDLPPEGPVGADVSRAVALYAALLYRERTTPLGVAEYDDMGGGGDTSAAMVNIHRLLGTRKPVAR